MATLTFTAHCQRGHDRIDFTDRAEFEAHMTGKHKAPRRLTGAGCAFTDGRKAPGWEDGRFEPYPWTAPRRTAGCIDRVAERIAAGEYRWPGRTYMFPVGPRQGLGEIAGEVA